MSDKYTTCNVSRGFFSTIFGQLLNKVNPVLCGKNKCQNKIFQRRNWILTFPVVHAAEHCCRKEKTSPKLSAETDNYRNVDPLCPLLCATGDQEHNNRRIGFNLLALVWHVSVQAEEDLFTFHFFQEKLLFGVLL